MGSKFGSVWWQQVLFCLVGSNDLIWRQQVWYDLVGSKFGLVWREVMLVWFGGCAGADERDRPGCHNPLLPLSSPGGPRGLRDNRQELND